VRCGGERQMTVQATAAHQGWEAVIIAWKWRGGRRPYRRGTGVFEGDGLTDLDGTSAQGGGSGGSSLLGEILKRWETDVRDHGGG
jgi:hypothetical protein